MGDRGKMFRETMSSLQLSHWSTARRKNKCGFNSKLWELQKSCSVKISRKDHLHPFTTERHHLYLASPWNNNYSKRCELYCRFFFLCDKTFMTSVFISKQELSFTSTQLVKRKIELNVTNPLCVTRFS